MIPQTLSVHPTQTARHELFAWYLRDDDPVQVLRAISQIDRPSAGFRLLLVPESRTDIHLRGVLVWHTDGPLSEPPPRWEAYGLVAGRLMLPIHAEVRPSVTDDELIAVLHHRWTVYEPTVGFVGFHEDNLLRPRDLIAVPDVRDGGWHAAIPSEPLNDRLHALRPTSPPNVDDLIRESGGDIGTREGTVMPRASNEPSDSWLARAGRGGQAAFGKALHRAMGGRAARGVAGSIAGWAAGMAAAATEANALLRKKEVNRLLEMLERDPLNGLKHAIPLGALNAPRGVAPPSNQLGFRLPDFNLGGMFGSAGPGDLWDIERKQQQALMDRYRQLALEEAQRGNHRRAAYIYAKLLADLNGAVEALINGGFHREAAVILREKLNQPERAAECLARGGLLLEAAELYEAIDKWIEAASIYGRLKDIENARRCYRRAVDACLHRSDRLEAARILESHLSEVEEAITTLRAGWEYARQGNACLQELYALLNRRGMHERVRPLTDEIVAATPQDGRAGSFATVLAGASVAATDRLLGAWLADRLRLLAADRLSRAADLPSGVANQFVSALADSCPEDKLLRRDGHAFVAGIRRKPVFKPEPRSKQMASNESIEVIHEWMLPGGATWTDLLVAGDSYVAFGVDKKRHQLIRGRPGADTYDKSSVTFKVVPEDGRFLPPGERVGTRVIVPTSEKSPYPDITFRESDRTPPLTLVHPSWLNQGIHALAEGRGKMVAALDLFALSVDIYRGDKERVGSHAIRDADLQRIRAAATDDQTVPLLYMAGEVIYVCVAGGVLRYRNGVWDTLECGGSGAVRLCGVHPYGRCRFALIHERGATLINDYPGATDSCRVGDQLFLPHGAFTFRAGHLVLADESQIEVYQSTGGKPQLIVRDARSSSGLVAVRAWCDGNEFLTLQSNGAMRFCRIKSDLPGG